MPPRWLEALVKLTHPRQQGPSSHSTAGEERQSFYVVVFVLFLMSCISSGSCCRCHRARERSAPRAGQQGVPTGLEDVESTQDVSVPPWGGAGEAVAFEQVVDAPSGRVFPRLGHSVAASGAEGGRV